MFQNMHKNHIVKSPRVVLITGASSGLGQSIARQLYRSGHEVYGTSRNSTSKEGFTMLPLDLTNNRSISNVVQEVVARSGHIDVLINNAGVDGAGPLEAMSAAHMEYLFQVNVFGAARLTSEVLPHMRRQQSGLIINMSSLAAVNGLPYRSMYSASKAALERLTESLRLELRSAGIKACYVQPGCFHTSINENRILPANDSGLQHYPRWPHVSEVIDQSVNLGLQASDMAFLIDRIVRARHIKACYRIGKPVEKLSAALKGILPAIILEFTIKKYFKA